MPLRRLESRCDLLALQQRDPQRYPCLLESAASGTPRARYDVLLGFPQAGLTLDVDGITRDLDGAVAGSTFLDALDAQWEQASAPAMQDERDLPFRGGWALYLGYELVAQLESRLDLPRTIDPLPVALALRCPAALVFDHLAGALFAVAEPGHEPMLDAMTADVDRASRLEPADTSLPVLCDVAAEDDARDFIAGVQRVLDYIAAGDVFQVNLSRGWHARLAGESKAAAWHAALRRANPAPFAASLVQPGWSVASSSPERLVSVRGDRVETRPIAGTRARFPGDDEAERIRELVGHPKERAEHVMLIDLERNDLGRVCVPGSVEVDELMSVESYAHVHHIVSNVRGTLRPGTTPGQVIRAVFPGGTITGCPKVRCMQIIAELERVGRGPYTGAIGYLDRSGDLDLNILIRTLWTCGDVLRFRAGAGIVSDSDPEAELAETRAKARGLLRALGALDA